MWMRVKLSTRNLSGCGRGRSRRRAGETRAPLNAREEPQNWLTYYGAYDGSGQPG
jgi:hypothetical protein